MSEGILGIETDSLYQWRTLMPTYDRVLTRISKVRLQNINAGKVKFVSRILGEKELAVRDVRLKKVRAAEVTDRKHIHQNVEKFFPKEKISSENIEKPTEPTY